MFRACQSILFLSPILFGAASAHPQATQEATIFSDEILVTASSPLSHNSLTSNIPYQVQTFDKQAIEKNQYTSVANLLDRQALGVSVNHAQNNPLQPDVQVRGFSASPLLGAPQGVAVYLNGVRFNEPFGDTVNWDLLSDTFMRRISLVSGANATYGLNALGGSLIIATRTGFDSERNRVALSAGSFGRREWSASSGGNNGRWGYFIGVDSFEEDGWRDYSPSSADNAYGALSLRSENLEWDLYALAGESELHGNGAAPEQLLRQDREAVFTHPDITENAMFMFSNELCLELNADSSLNASLFARRNTTDSFNGDGSEFDECEAPLEGFLCDEDDDEAVEDQLGDLVPESFDAINNIGEREQTSWGGTLEYYRRLRLGGLIHNNSFGIDFYRGTTDFHSAVEFAQLRDNRSTTRSGLFHPEGVTELDSRVRHAALYWTDRIVTSERSQITLSLRYNNSELETEDQSGIRPELTSSHDYTNLNGGIGFTYTATDDLGLYGHLSQSSRTPTPVELACSHPDAPCNLPNTFLADPPLNEVAARNLELGLRSRAGMRTEWNLSGFTSRIDDDIVFQTTGGVSSNEGFFSNASDTQRLGVSGEYASGIANLHWSLRYTWLQATYEDNFTVSSPNHPYAQDGRIAVEPGDEIPGLPEHSLSLSTEWEITNQLSWRWDAHYQSGVYLRGDEANQDEKTGSATVANTTLSYKPRPPLELYLAVNNVFNTEFESFGLYGEPDEVLPDLDAENNRFLSPNEPHGAWVGARYSW